MMMMVMGNLGRGQCSCSLFHSDAHAQYTGTGRCIRVWRRTADTFFVIMIVMTLNSLWIRLLLHYDERVLSNSYYECCAIPF